MVNKSMKKLFVGLAVLSTAANLSADAVQSTSKGFFQPRAASANIAREMLMQQYGNQHRNSEGWYGEFAATAFYQRGWNENSVDSGATDSQVSGMGAFPFWSSTNAMSVGNSVTTAAGVVSTTPNVDGYQFGLGTTTANGSVELDPIIYQAGADFMFVVGSSANEPGFLFKIKAPIAVYNINPNLSEVEATNAASYAAGALTTGTGAAAVTIPAGVTMTQAFAGTTGDQPTLGDYAPMQFGLINGVQSTGAKFGDIEMTAGYSFVSNEDNSVAVAVRASAPTGNKATGVYMLEPIVGRGGNWGLGGYAAGHVSLWEGNNDNKLTFKFMSDVMHLFTTSTMRSYDLTDNGGGSKYLLVADYNSGVYQSSIQNLINVSTLASNSSFGVEGDVAVAFNYAARGFSVDLGYEFYGRSAETLAITGDFDTRYAVLGHQGVGQVGGTPATGSNACQPFATMQNAAAPSAATIVSTAVITSATPDAIGNATIAGNQVSLADLNVAGAAQSAYLTSKIFTKLAYEWENSDYVPFLGVIGEFEFSNCLNNALPQWGVALVGGVSF